MKNIITLFLYLFKKYKSHHFDFRFFIEDIFSFSMLTSGTLWKIESFLRFKNKKNFYLFLNINGKIYYKEYDTTN